MIIRDRKREAYIYEQRKQGRTFASIAADLGITGNRVRQIYTREDWERNGPNCDHWKLHFKKHPEDEEPWTTHYYQKHGKAKPEG